MGLRTEAAAARGHVGDDGGMDTDGDADAQSIVLPCSAARPIDHPNANGADW